MNTPEMSSNNYSSVEFSNEEATTSGMVPNFDSAKPSTSKYGLLDQEESSDDTVYQFSSAIKRPNEGLEYYPSKRLREEDPEFDEPSTSGIRSTRSVESASLQGNQDKDWSDESSDDESSQVVLDHLINTDKCFYENNEVYSDKKARFEELELNQPGTSGIGSTFYNVESSDEYSSDESGNEGSKCEELESFKPGICELKSKASKVESSAAKRTLQGLFYQLKLLMFFVQRVPDGHEFYLSTQIHEAGHFDDIVLRYQGNDNKWRYRFLQGKHKNDDKFKIEISDLFNKKAKSSKHIGEDKPYLLQKYFKSYCDIEQNIKFENANLEEFLICTNVGFAENAKIYFECAEKNDDDPILRNLVIYRLIQKQISELREEFEINDHNENCFLNFVAKFKFLPNYENDELYENIQNCLKKCIKTENVDLAHAYSQNLVLKWLESYRDKNSKYLHIEDKEEFVKSLNRNIDSLLVVGYSKFYAEELNSYGVKFENTLFLSEFFDHKKDKIMFIMTSTPKLSIIKLSQMFSELKLRQDEVIFTNDNQLNYNQNIFTTFFAGASYKWLVIEYQLNEIKLREEILDKILKTDKEKTVLIIAPEDHVLNLNKCLRLNKPCFVEKNNLFRNLTIVSQKNILKKKIIFQEKITNLSELIDIYTGQKIIDQITLEKLITETIKIEDNNAFETDFLIEDYYIQRKLIQRELGVDILQNEEFLKCCLFIISGINRDQLKDLKINEKWIFMWEDGKTFNNGIILSTTNESRDIFYKFGKNNRENVCWLEHIGGQFSIMNISNDTDILRKHFICLDEHDLYKKQVLEKKILIISDGPGCGKSMFMTKVAHQLKQKLSNGWVLGINLSSYAYKQEKHTQVMKSLDDIKFEDIKTNKAIQFLADLLFSQENENENKHFIRELIIQSLDCLNKNMKFPKIILLFDGFDEISPTFKEKILILLKALQNSNVAQMWVTTRHQEALSLQVALHSSPFFFKPLDLREKVDFLQKIWKYNFMNFDNIEPKPVSKDVLTYLTEITNNICNCGDRSISDSFRDFQNHWRPTHIYSKLQLLLSNLNFSVIAKRVIHFLEYFNLDRESKFAANPLQLKMAAEIIFFKKFSSLDKLDIFSLYQEFTKYKLNVFRGDKDAAEKSVEDCNLFKKYLEYLTIVPQGTALVNQYFAKNFQFENVQKIIFSDILINKNDSLIRNFLNNNEIFLGKLGSKSQQMIEIIRVNSFDLLSQMLKEKLYNLFMKFLENLPPDLAKNNIFFNKNNDGKTVLHRICESSLDEQILENILKAIKDSVSSEILMELFFERDKRECTALHCINFYRKYSVLIQILQFFKLNCDSKSFGKLLLQVNDLGETILHLACKCGHDITNLLEVSDENRDTVRDLLLETDNEGRTALFNTIRSSYNSSLLTTLLKLVKLVCNSEEIYYLFSIKSNSKNQLHAACSGRDKDMLIIVLNAIKDNPELIKTLLLETDKEGLSPLHYTVPYYFYFDNLKILLDFVNLNCDTEMLHTILCKRTKYGQTILHMAVNNFKVTHDHNSLTPLLTYLFSLVGNDKEIFYELLLTTDKYGRTVLHCTSSKLDYPFLLKELLDFVQTNCSENILSELLLKFDDNKSSILHWVCCQNDVGNLTFLLNKIKDDAETLNKLLLQTDKEGDTALHCTVFCSDKSSMMSELLNFVKLNCEKEIFKSLLCKANDEGLNVLHFACMRIGYKRENEDHLKSLLKFIKDDNILINELLLKICNNHGCTPLHYTVRYFDNASLLKILLDFIKNYDFTMLNTLLLKESSTGCSLLHFACRHSNEECLKYLLYAMQDNIAIRDILILKPDHNGQTILHYSVDNFQMLKFFLDFVKSQCDQEMFTNLILKCDQEGRTGLHTLCQTNDNKEILTYLLSLVKNNTTPEVFNLFLSKKDCHGKMASDYIACNTNNFPLLEVLSNFGIQLPNIIDDSRLID